MRDVFAGSAWHKWVEVFVEFYLTHARVCDMSESCPLRSRSLEVAQSCEESRSACEAGMQKVAKAIADGLEGGSLANRTMWSARACVPGKAKVKHS